VFHLFRDGKPLAYASEGFLGGKARSLTCFRSL